MRFILLFAFAVSLTACAARAQVDSRAGPVTAGPFEGLQLAAGESGIVHLGNTTDRAAVRETEGLIVTDGRPVMVSGRLGLVRGSASAIVQVGTPRDGWRVVAIGANPPIFGPLIVRPGPGEFVRVIAESALGATIAGGADVRQTWVTSVPVNQPGELQAAAEAPRAPVALDPSATLDQASVTHTAVRPETDPLEQLAPRQTARTPPSPNRPRAGPGAFVHPPAVDIAPRPPRRVLTRGWRRA